MTRIPLTALRVQPAARIPEDWAQQLGSVLAPALGLEGLAALVQRRADLGGGMVLAHLRTGVVDEPALGAWKATDPEAGDAPWLRLVAMLPEGDAARQLDWMARLAAGLHHDALRVRLREASTPEALAGALGDAMAVRERAERPTEQLRSLAPPPSTAYRLIVAILKEPEAVDHLLTLLLEHGIRGATVLEGRGMAEHLAAHMSLFAGFKSAFKAVGHSQVVLSLVPAHRAEEVLGLVQQGAGGLERHGTGIAFAIDAPLVVGLGKGED